MQLDVGVMPLARPRRRRSRVDGRTVADGVVRLGDILVVAASGAIAAGFRFDGIATPDVAVTALLVGVLIAANVLPLLRIYDFELLARLTHQLPRLVAGHAISVCAVLALLFAMKSAETLSRLWVLYWFLGGIGGFIGWRIAVKLAIERAQQHGSLRRNIVLVGDADLIADCVRRLAIGGLHIKVAGVLTLDGTVPRLPPGAARIRDLAELLPAIRDVEADQIVLAMPLGRTGEIMAILKRLKHLSLEVGLYPETVGIGLPLLGVSQVGDAPLLRLLERPLDGWRYVMKSLEDRVLAAVLLLLVAPVLLLIAAGIRLTSPGPIFYRQQRHGFDRDPISVFKFRTMHASLCDAPDAAVVLQATDGDPRVTSLGRILRRTSLDELPQLINVLKGEMSLVGPRPHAVAHDDYYSERIDDYLARHRVKPGMTGWAQINGCRGETRTLEQMRRRIELDLWYIEHWSLLLDLRIILRTAFFGMRQANAY